MIQCIDCEYFHKNDHGEIALRCDPFGTVREPECLTKWQLIKVSQMVAGYQATLDYYRRLAPMQEKMFKVMEREIDEMSEAEKWKVADAESPDGAEEDDDFGTDDDWRPSADDSPYP